MIYLIPSFLSENAVETIPPYVIDVVKNCQVIFAENLRTARRFLKACDPTIVIDNYEWHAIHKTEAGQIPEFQNCLRQNKNVAIISEAGCPGIADPGQILIEIAQQMNVQVKPLVGPSSILLSLMASGMNGQCFTFLGYLPIDASERLKKIRQIEEESSKRDCTQIFIETPYRNDALLKDLLRNCHAETLLCIAVDITSSNESIQTKTISEWKKMEVSLHKKPVIFLIKKN